MNNHFTFIVACCSNSLYTYAELINIGAPNAHARAAARDLHLLSNNLVDGVCVSSSFFQGVMVTHDTREISKSEWERGHFITSFYSETCTVSIMLGFLVARAILK